MTFTDLILPELLPKIARGAQGEGCSLSDKDCVNLMNVLRVSVTIETLIEQMAGLCRNTLAGDQLIKSHVVENPHLTKKNRPIG